MQWGRRVPSSVSHLILANGVETVEGVSVCDLCRVPACRAAWLCNATQQVQARGRTRTANQETADKCRLVQRAFPNARKHAQFCCCAQASDRTRKVHGRLGTIHPRQVSYHEPTVMRHSIYLRQSVRAYKAARRAAASMPWARRCLNAISCVRYRACSSPCICMRVFTTSMGLEKTHASAVDCHAPHRIAHRKNVCVSAPRSAPKPKPRSPSGASGNYSLATPNTGLGHWRYQKRAKESEGEGACSLTDPANTKLAKSPRSLAGAAILPCLQTSSRSRPRLPQLHDARDTAKQSPNSTTAPLLFKMAQNLDGQLYVEATTRLPCDHAHSLFY